MKTSSVADVRAMYDEIAESYSHMMDEEIRLPIFDKILRLLHESIAGLSGPVLDTSCGTGHLLRRLRDDFDSERALCGIDLAENMVAATKKLLGPNARIELGDMRDLSTHSDGSVAAVVSMFAIHHLDRDALLPTFVEWRRVLRPGGQLLLGTWEGEEPIDYGDAADLVAVRHSEKLLLRLLAEAGFDVHFTEARFEDEMGMNSIYLLAAAC